MRLIQALAFEVLDTNRSLIGIEEHPGRERIELDRELMRIFFLDIEQPLPRPEAAMVTRVQRCVAGPKGVLAHQAPIIGIALALQEPLDAAKGLSHSP